MSSKQSRAGGKFGGRHTSVIPAAAVIADAAARQPEVAKIAPGLIKAGLSSVGGKRRVKFTVHMGIVYAAVRGGTSHQRLTIHTKEQTVTVASLSQAAQQAGFAVTGINVQK